MSSFSLWQSSLVEEYFFSPLSNTRVSLGQARHCNIPRLDWLSAADLSHAGCTLHPSQTVPCCLGSVRLLFCLCYLQKGRWHPGILAEREEDCPQRLVVMEASLSMRSLSVSLSLSLLLSHGRTSFPSLPKHENLQGYARGSQLTNFLGWQAPWARFWESSRERHSWPMMSFCSSWQT